MDGAGTAAGLGRSVAGAPAGAAAASAATTGGAADHAPHLLAQGRHGRVVDHVLDGRGEWLVQRLLDHVAGHDVTDRAVIDGELNVRELNGAP